MATAAHILRRLGRLLDQAPEERALARPVRVARPPARRINYRSRPAARWLDHLLDRLDCTPAGASKRTGKPAWPESWPAAVAVAEHLGAEFFVVHVLACWLERQAATTRGTYATAVLSCLRMLRVQRVVDLVELPTEAGLTWQRAFRREVSRRGAPRSPRTVNCATAALNSLMAFCEGLGLRRTRWVPIAPVPVNRGRHCDVEPVVLTLDQLSQFWDLAARRPRRQLLALLLASLHGLRAAEVASLRWRDFRYRRRGTSPAPAVWHVIGKGSKHRTVQVHPALRGWLERERPLHGRDDWVLADAAGEPPQPEQVSYWAKAVFRWMGLPEGYAHALRATWATLALENRANQPLQVQQSGGWRRMDTMLGHYFKRRNTPLVRLVGETA